MGGTILSPRLLQGIPAHFSDNETRLGLTFSNLDGVVFANTHSSDQLLKRSLLVLDLSRSGVLLGGVVPNRL